MRVGLMAIVGLVASGCQHRRPAGPHHHDSNERAIPDATMLALT